MCKLVKYITVLFHCLLFESKRLRLHRVCCEVRYAVAEFVLQLCYAGNQRLTSLHDCREGSSLNNLHIGVAVLILAIGNAINGGMFN